MPESESSAIARRRLRNQRIGAAPLGSPGEVVEWLVASQAQDYAGAKWALGLRMRGARDRDLDEAFNRGEILRTHVLRPTWHFVAPADVRWLLALTAPHVHRSIASAYRQLELDRATHRRCQSVIQKALEGGRHHTRTELRRALEEAGIKPAEGRRLAYIMLTAELDGLICSGPRRGKQFTYALLEERAPNAGSFDRDQALATLASRYAVSRGPAAAQDLAKWSGLTVAEARRGLEAAGVDLLRERIDGREYWSPASAPSGSKKPARAHLLSVYDEYISSYKDRRAIGGERVGALLSRLGNAALTYVVVVDGQIAGASKRWVEKQGVRIEIRPLRELARSEERAVVRAARRFGDFLEMKVTLSFADPERTG